MSEPLLPLPHSIVSDAALASLRKRRDEEGGRATADNTRGRGSISHQCSRRIALDDAGVLRSEPEDDWSLVAFQVGQDWHDRTQAVLEREFGAHSEQPVTWKPDHDVSGNVDVELDINPLNGETGPNLVTGEIKSMKLWSWEQATGTSWRQKLDIGPKAEHVTQAAMYALAPRRPLGIERVESRYLWMIYGNKDSGQIAEWMLPVDEPLPHIPGTPTPRQLAENEIRRFEQIFAVVDAGEVPRPSVPGHGLIDDPFATDGYWGCKFCPHRRTCNGLGSQRQPLDMATEVAVALTTATGVPAASLI